MRLPLDTSSMQFIAVLDPVQTTDFETKAPKTNADGELMWEVQVAAMAPGGAEVVKVKIAREPKVKQGESLRVQGLTTALWSMEGGRHGLSYWADKIEPLAGPAPSTARKVEA